MGLHFRILLMFQSEEVYQEENSIHEDVIKDRLFELENLIKSTIYMKQKSRLQVELEMFLGNLSIPKTLANASPEDVRKFLVFKDGNGKTQVHVLSCAHVGKKMAI